MFVYKFAVLGLFIGITTPYLSKNPSRTSHKSILSATNNDPSKLKERIISPDDIASLFGSEFSYDDGEDSIEFESDGDILPSNKLDGESSDLSNASPVIEQIPIAPLSDATESPSADDNEMFID